MMRKIPNREYPYYKVPEVETIRELACFAKNEGSDKTVFYRGKDNEEPITYGEFYSMVESLGTFLLNKGLKNNQIAVLGEDSTEWCLAYFAIACSGNVIVPLDKGLSKEELYHSISFTECKAVFYSKNSEEFADYFKEKNPDLLYLCMDGIYDNVQEGKALIEKGDSSFADLVIDKNQLAAIVFTSGTSGTQKGVMLTHYNVMSDLVAAAKHVEQIHTMFFLPFHHTFVWTGFLSCFATLADGHVCSNMKRFTSDIKRFAPEGFELVPMAAELIHKNIFNSARRQGKEKKLKFGLKLSRFLMAIGIDKRRDIFKDVIEQFGGNLSTLVIGGAAMDPQIEKDLYYLGFNPAVGYGITECSPVVTTNRIHDFRFGSVGKPIPCCKVRIADPDEEGNGEIQVSGPNVMMGYYKDEEATKEVFDGEWFKTGDVGHFDKDGFLYITGRKKNLIVLSNGENISPEELEIKLSHIPYVKEVVVYEENNKIVAEFYLDEENDPKAKEKIDADVLAFNKSMPLSKNINKIKIRDIPFEKTTTMKIKRYLIKK